MTFTADTRGIHTPVAIGQILHRHVGQPFHDRANSHRLNHAWVQQVKNQHSSYHRKTLLEQGTADFTRTTYGLTPDDKALLYSYYYLQRHLASGIFVLQSWERQMDQSLPWFNRHSAIIDLGCGPMTFGLALRAHQLLKGRGLQGMQYIGIDRAESMIRKASAIATDLQQCSSAPTFLFGQNFQEIHSHLRRLDGVVQSRGTGWLVFSSSYLFASPTLDVSSLFEEIHNVLQRHPDHNWCFIQQNPPVSYLNHKWHQFCNLLDQHYPDFRTQASEISIPYAEYSLEPETIGQLVPKTSIKLSYEILTREVTP